MGTPRRLRKAFHVHQAAETLATDSFDKGATERPHDDSTSASRHPPPEDAPAQFPVSPGSPSGAAYHYYNPQPAPAPWQYPQYGAFMPPSHIQTPSHQYSQPHNSQYGQPHNPQQPGLAQPSVQPTQHFPGNQPPPHMNQQSPLNQHYPMSNMNQSQHSDSSFFPQQQPAPQYGPGPYTQEPPSSPDLSGSVNSMPPAQYPNRGYSLDYPAPPPAPSPVLQRYHTVAVMEGNNRLPCGHESRCWDYQLNSCSDCNMARSQRPWGG